MQSKGYLFLLLVLVLSVGSGFLYSSKPYQFGLDIQGGMRLTYRMKVEDLKPEQRQDMIGVRRKLETVLSNRVAAGLGVVEGVVKSKGTDQFVVELPGYTNAEAAREMLKSTASIKAYDAKNVISETNPYRLYSDLGVKTESGSPYVEFTKVGSSSPLKPTDPAYQEMIQGWDLILEGDQLVSAELKPNMAQHNEPHFNFSSSGAKRMKEFSLKYKDRGQKLAFVLDGRVLSIAPVAKGAILEDTAYIQNPSGNIDTIYLRKLVELLNAGSLPVGLVETSSQSIDPTIGKHALGTMINAGLISFAFIALFLLLYYSFPGVVALLALGLYVLFTITAMKMISATFSLAAIAGFILSVGMAVDANILVFERLKEEMREGRSLQSAVELGFRRALPAIVDSNACTILTSLVLMWLGTSAVKGFATMLIVGVAISLFTAVTVTRSLLVFLVGSGFGNNPKWYGLDRQWFGEGLEKEANKKPLQIVNRWKLYLGISAATIAPGLIFIFMGGIRPNVEFQGGLEATYRLESPSQTPESIGASLKQSGYKGYNVKVISGDEAGKMVEITLPPGSVDTASPAVYEKLGQQASVKPLENQSITTVGPEIRAETLANAIKAVIISSLLIVIYLTMRFGFAIGGVRNGIKFGLSAIGALVHDVLVVIGVAAIFGYFMNWEVGMLFVTSMLTVIGFSVHDTIVIFDRIRENLRKPIKGETFENLCNRSITQSIARSINTAGTVIVTLIILIGWGTATVDLKFFSIVMLTGILSGTYSSIFNASPILFLWDKWTEKRRGPGATLIEEAQQEMRRIRAAAMAIEVPTPVGTSTAPSRGYGQVKRRDSAVESSKHRLDD